MNFAYSNEQDMLKNSVSRFVLENYSFDQRRVICDGSNGYSDEHWRLFSELGWLMVPVKEELGGLGGGSVDLMLLMEEFGKGLVVEPFIPTMVLGANLLGELATSQPERDIVTSVMEGTIQLAFAFAEPTSRYSLANMATTATASADGGYTIDGHKGVVLNGANADHLIVSARTSGQASDDQGITLFVVDPNSSGVDINDYPTVDGFRAAEIKFDNVNVASDAVLGEVGTGLDAIEKTIDLATVAICAEAVGIMEVLYKKTVEYTKARHQFGKPLSSFQALQHRMADMFIEYEQAKSIVLMAATTLDAQQGFAPKAVSAAKSRVGKAARLIGQEAVQLHGGMGVTDELDIGHYFKRLTSIQFMFGSADYHTQRFARL